MFGVRRNKIAVMHLRSSTGFYGAEWDILGVLKFLDKDRISSVLTCFAEPGCEEFLDVGKKYGAITEKISGGKSVVKQIRQLVYLVKKYDIDIIHTHEYKSDILGLITAKITNKKIIATPHSWSGNESWQVVCYEMLDRGLLRFFDMILPLNSGIERQVRLPVGTRSRIRVIPTGLIRDSIRVTESVDIRSRYRIPPSTGIICYIGRFVERKRVEDIIRASAIVLDKVPLKLFLIGDGMLYERLKELVCELHLENDVIFTLFREDRLDFLYSSDALILASTNEGLPVCIMEAMYLQKPVIATNIPGVADLVSNNESGILVPPCDPNALAKAIEVLFKDQELRSRMGEAGKRILEERFVAERMAGDYQGVYESLINEQL